MYNLRLKVLVFCWLRNNDRESRIHPHSILIMGVGIIIHQSSCKYNTCSQYIVTLQGKSHIKRLEQGYKETIKRHIVSFI